MIDDMTNVIVSSSEHNARHNANILQYHNIPLINKVQNKRSNNDEACVQRSIE